MAYSSSSALFSSEEDEMFSRTRSRNLKRRRTDPLLEQISLLSSSLRDYLNARTAKSSQDSDADGCRAFARLVGSELQCMPLEEQREKKRRILAVLYGGC